jgi:hypothetical protein
MSRSNRLVMAVGGLATVAALTFALLASSDGTASAANEHTAASTMSDALTSNVEDEYASDYAEGVVDIVLDDQSLVDGYGATVDGSTVTITAAGVYSISGTLTDGQLVVDAKGKVYLEFGGVDITSSSGPALLISDAKKVTLTLVEGSSNFLTDSAGDREYDAALYTNDTLIINGKGSLVVTGNSNEGISSDDDIIINAGTIRVTAVDDGLNAHDDITITGGSVYVEANGDGLDSNGTINLLGGTLIALGSAVAGDGGLDATGAVTISGGTLVASGASIATPCAESTQSSLYLSAGSTQVAGTSVSIVREGEEILTFRPEAAYQNILVSSDCLLAGVVYQVYIGSSSIPITAVAAKVPVRAGAADAAAAATVPLATTGEEGGHD